MVWVPLALALVVAFITERKIRKYEEEFEPRSLLCARSLFNLCMWAVGYFIVAMIISLFIGILVTPESSVQTEEREIDFAGINVNDGRAYYIYYEKNAQNIVCLNRTLVKESLLNRTSERGLLKIHTTSYQQSWWYIKPGSVRYEFYVPNETKISSFEFGFNFK